MESLHLTLKRGWRAAWELLPDELLPLRLRLAGLARALLGEPPTGRYDPEDRAGYAAWIARFDTLSAADRAAIRAHVAALPAAPLISVVMPAHETPAPLLRAAIASVEAQLWPHWELCIADDASPSPQVAQVLAEAAARDPRIRWVRRATNGDVAAATNSALALARGDYVALMDHDDLLPDHALYQVAAEIAAHPEAEVLYSDEDRLDAAGRRFGACFKPDFDPDLLLGQNLVGHLGVYRRDLLTAIGGLREGMEGGQDHDLALRATAAAGPGTVRHIPAILYHRRLTGRPSHLAQARLDRRIAASRRAVADALAARGIAARLEPAPLAPAHTRVVWPLPDPAPLVSVIVPTRDRAGLLATCAEGVLERTDYPAIEFLVVDNGSVEPETLALFDRLRADPRVRILAAPGPFNYSALNNQAAEMARGEILLLLNNDIEVIEPHWLREMVSQAVRPEIGAVGAKLLYADGRLQHGGVVTGVGGVADHYLLRAARDDAGYCNSLALARAAGAVTGACLALRRAVYREVGGLDAAQLVVAFNDVDLCVRIRQAGYRVLWTPFAELYHLESASRGQDLAPEKARRFAGEIDTMRRRWGDVLLHDPFYSPWLSLEGAHGALARQPRRIPPWTPYIGAPHPRATVSPARRATPPPPAPRAAPASPAGPPQPDPR
ncbi:glycosyltransferase family 2 protein [Dankookia sp. GCM10030260]|uniref:glycosyltransferase family 2 protein n=1 Tax=Dankookia sp. GCM10030260 TaxID=3273390 RepID=UPI003621EB42